MRDTNNTHRGDASVETTFHNVTITISARNTKEAYSILCEALDPLGAEWTTDTYSTDKVTDKDTAELFG